jgi:hypothetical protein
MKKQNLDNLIEQKEQFDKPSQAIIDNLSFRRAEIGKIAETKNTAGWKIMETKIRETLHERINDLIKDDATILSLLTLLNAGDTQSMSEQLAREISGFLPE